MYQYLVFDVIDDLIVVGLLLTVISDLFKFVHDDGNVEL